MNDLFLRALRCEPTPRRPIWLMRQAGRLLPEYRAVREKYSFEEMCATPELAAEVTLMPIERFGFDAAVIFADLVTPLSALGLSVSFEPAPVIDRPVSTEADVAALAEPKAGEICPEVMETIRLVREGLAGRAAVLGFAGAPWTVAAYVVKGGSRSGFPGLRALAAGNEPLLHSLLDKLARLGGHYLADQVRAGADAVQVFDSWAGVLSREAWERYSRPHIETMLRIAGEAGARRIYFSQGAPHLIDAAADLPVEGFSIDWRVDLADVRRRFGPDIPLQGNIDPAILLAGPGPTAAAARSLLGSMPGRGHVVNLGHGVLPDTPIESVQALLDAVHIEESNP